MKTIFCFVLHLLLQLLLVSSSSTTAAAAAAAVTWKSKCVGCWKWRHLSSLRCNAAPNNASATAIKSHLQTRGDVRYDTREYEM